MAVQARLNASTFGAEADAAVAADGRFFVHPAGADDIPSLEQVEREAFPEQWPPSRFANEIRKPEALYLIATSPGPSVQEVAGASATPPAPPAPPASSPMPARPRRSLFSLIRNASRLGMGAWRRNSGPPATPPSYAAGFVGMWFVVDEAHVVSIGVRRVERRRGVGELLLLGAFDAARRRKMNVLTLEVRKTNSGAQALYAKYGFREAGLRKKYYVDNGEDAIIMTTPPISTPDFARRLQRLSREHAARWGRPPRATAATN
jgi:ribosomal-protein-alanine N-acetyltransferase